MKIVILCGGKGTRIRDVSNNDIPKPMIPIGQFPIIFHIMKSYSYYGYKDFILCLGHLGWKIKDYFLNFKYHKSDFTLNLKSNQIYLMNCNGNELDWNITFAETGENTHTGARIRKIKKYVENDSVFMVTYGDGVSNIDIKQLVSFHKKHGKIGTISGVRPSGRFGEIETDGKNRVNGFNEKPQITAGRINGGFFVFNTEGIWNYLDHSDDNLIFEREPLMMLAKDNELMMFPHDGFWQPMDTYREYLYLNKLWSDAKKGKIIPWTT